MENGEWAIGRWCTSETKSKVEPVISMSGSIGGHGSRMVRQVDTGIKVRLRSSGDALTFAIEWCPRHQSLFLTKETQKSTDGNHKSSAKRHGHGRRLGPGCQVWYPPKDQLTEQKIQSSNQQPTIHNPNPQAHRLSKAQAPSGTTPERSTEYPYFKSLEAKGPSG